LQFNEILGNWWLSLFSVVKWLGFVELYIVNPIIMEITMVHSIPAAEQFPESGSIAQFTVGILRTV
jgi:hypothetical protein